jgi:hypothetical protein
LSERNALARHVPRSSYRVLRAVPIDGQRRARKDEGTRRRDGVIAIQLVVLEDVRTRSSPLNKPKAEQYQPL